MYLKVRNLCSPVVNMRRASRIIVSIDCSGFSYYFHLRRSLINSTKPASARARPSLPCPVAHSAILVLTLSRSYCTAGNCKFLLLHDGKSDDSVKNFFVDVHDA